MKKHELLKKAYDNYPKGTKFMGAGIEEFVSSGCFNIVNGNILKDNYGLVYDVDNDKWADIIVEFKPKSILDGKVAIQANKPKEIKLRGERHTCFINTDESIELGYKDSLIILHKSDIEEIYKAIKQLNK